MNARKLKDSLLNYALLGQLVEQLDSEGSSEILIQNIKQDKEIYISKTSKSIKKSLPAIRQEEINELDIPHNWTWVRLGEIALSIDAGKSPKCEEINVENDEWGVIKTTAIQENEFVESKNKILPKAFEIKPSYIIENGDVLITRAGPKNRVGISCVVDNLKLNLILSDKTLKIKINKEYINPYYLSIVLNSPLIKKSLEAKMSGMANSQVNISQDKLKLICIPIPPFKEQSRIVEKFNALLEKSKEYELTFEKLNTLQNKFPFELEKSILQYAMQGKLVEQNPQDQPANTLINAINFEKEQLIKEKVIKKEKPLSPINNDEIPFELPSTWKWVRLGEIYYNHGQKKPDNLFEYIDVAAIDNNLGKISGELNVLEQYEAPSRARKIVKKGDIIYSTVRPYLKNIAIVDREFNYEAIASTAFIVMSTKLNSEYLFYVLRSPMFDQQVTANMKGVAYPAINDTAFNNLIIPVPPLEEQKRIVKKIKVLLKLKNTLNFLN